MARFPGFNGPTYALPSVDADCQRTINLFPEKHEGGGQFANGELYDMISCPGLKLKASVGTGPIRGAWFTSGGRLAVVSGNQLYRVDPDWTSYLIGTLNSLSGRVGMADNGLQLMLVDGAFGYIVNLATGAMTRITSDGFNGANRVIFLGGYFVCNNPGTGQWFRSNSYDGFTWDPLNYATAESSPDNLRTIVGLHDQLWLFGTNTIEPWWNSGSSSTFSRVQNAVIQYGCVAPETAILYNNSVAWLGGGPNAQGIVWQAVGYQPQRISNHAVEAALQSYGDNIYKATAYAYQANGHSFYCLNVPGSNTTWVYDVATQMWHERCYLGRNGFERHRGEVYVQAYGLNLVGDYVNGNIYALDDSVYSDNGNPLVRLRRAPKLSKNLKRMFHQSLEIDMERGVGLDGGSTVNVTQFATGDGSTATFTIPSDPGTAVYVSGIYLTDWSGTHLLSPSARTNYLIKSNAFNDAAWTKPGSSVVADAVAGPDGLVTADKVIEDTSIFARHAVRQVPVSTAGPQIFSVYAMMGTRSKIELQIGSAPSFVAAFDLLSGVCNSGYGATTGITPVASAPGWYRCWVALVAAANDAVTISLQNSDGLSVYTGDGASYVYLAKAQLEPTT